MPAVPREAPIASVHRVDNTGTDRKRHRKRHRTLPGDASSQDGSGMPATAVLQLAMALLHPHVQGACVASASPPKSAN